MINGVLDLPDSWCQRVRKVGDSVFIFENIQSIVTLDNDNEYW